MGSFIFRRDTDKMHSSQKEIFLVFPFILPFCKERERERENDNGGDVDDDKRDRCWLHAGSHQIVLPIQTEARFTYFRISALSSEHLVLTVAEGYFGRKMYRKDGISVKVE